MIKRKNTKEKLTKTAQSSNKRYDKMNVINIMLELEQ